MLTVDSRSAHRFVNLTGGTTHGMLYFFFKLWHLMFLFLDFVKNILYPTNFMCSHPVFMILT